METINVDTYLFLNDSGVFRLYAYVRELSSSNLRETLASRRLSCLGDEKVLRVKLLYSLVLEHCPNARIPWSTTPKEIDGNEAARMWLLAEAVHDLFWLRQEVDRRTLMRETQAETAEKIKKPTEPIETRLNYLTSLKQWGLNFTGETGQPARNFLENLKDYRKFTLISDRLLFGMLPCILDEKTRSWFRAKNFTSWDVFEPSFLNALVLLRDDDYPASPRLVSVAVDDSGSLKNSIHEPKPDIHKRPYRSSSYCLQALKNKSSEYASSRSTNRKIEDDYESVISESVSSTSSVYDQANASNFYHANPGHHYPQPTCEHSSANDYAYHGGYASSGPPRYDAVVVNSAFYDECAAVADRAVPEVAYSSEPYGLYYRKL